MLKKFTSTILAVAAIVMSIICTVYIWELAGFILMGLSVLWYIYESVMFALKNKLYVIISVAVLLILGIGVWFPIALVGLSLSVAETFFIFGAIADALALAYVWSY